MGSIQEDIIVTNMNASDARTHNFLKQTLLDLKGERGSEKVIVGASTTHLHQWTIQTNKINRETVK